MGTITLITGGARSGKSMQALKLALPYQRKFFVATGEALDDEMTARIEFHRTTRPAEFQTVEEPVNVVAAIERLGKTADLVVIDCLTLWVSNLMLRHGDERRADSRGGGQARGGAEGGGVREYRRDRRSGIGNRADRSCRVAPLPRSARMDQSESRGGRGRGAADGRGLSA